MAEQNRYKANTPVFGNLAYDLDALVLERNLEEAGRVQAEQRRQEENIQRRAVARPRQKVSLAALAGVVVLAAMAIGLLLGYIQLNNLSNSASELKEQLSELHVEHVALLTKYEQTYDLATVKERAEAAGMSKPTSGQIEYIDLGGSDTATVYRADSEGAIGGLMKYVKQGWETTVEYFS